MALCCDMSLDNCYKCGKATWVHVERPDARNFAGWGCANPECGDVKEFEVNCPEKGCKTKVKRYAREKSHLMSDIWYKCREHKEQEILINERQKSKRNKKSDAPRDGVVVEGKQESLPKPKKGSS